MGNRRTTRLGTTPGASSSSRPGFPPALWFEEDPGGPPPPDEVLPRALHDEMPRAPLREGLRLSERDRKMVSGIVRQVGEAREPEKGEL